ncbi:uncharacterized protein LOC128984952 [Macrosteles quadrilineatus]|uniref:uncharacterized protein LOC128984952 n=1 Tax=Macrosteles quadrilineatus TaxID=74068 RepID=UPI0023E0F12D|nr:uncharacterized protein LOC128984952 [Macrosteles quadrilineatus]
MARIQSPDDIFSNPDSSHFWKQMKNKSTAPFPIKQVLHNHQIQPESNQTLDDIIDSIPEEEPAEIVTRKDWGAREPSKAGKKVKTPVKILVLKYGTRTPPCESKEECIKTVQDIQRRHMDEMGMEDIGYKLRISKIPIMISVITSRGTCDS